jgi:hypothetical protein
VRVVAGVPKSQVRVGPVWENSLPATVEKFRRGETVRPTVGGSEVVRRGGGRAVGGAAGAHTEELVKTRMKTIVGGDHEDYTGWCVRAAPNKNRSGKNSPAPLLPAALTCKTDQHIRDLLFLSLACMVVIGHR